MRICKLGLLLSGQQWMGDSKRRRHTDRTILWQGASKYYTKTDSSNTYLVLLILK